MIEYDKMGARVARPKKNLPAGIRLDHFQWANVKIDRLTVSCHLLGGQNCTPWGHAKRSERHPLLDRQPELRASPMVTQG
jgi:hypothetical protein